MIQTKQNTMNASNPSKQTIDHVVEGKKAWVRADIQRDDWFFRLSPECLSELKAIILELRGDAGPVEQIDPARFQMPACRDFMRRVQAALDEGVRFAVVDRLPMDEISDDQAKAM